MASKYVVKVNILNDIFLYVLPLHSFSFRHIREKPQFNFRYDYASFWHRPTAYSIRAFI